MIAIETEKKVTVKKSSNKIHVKKEKKKEKKKRKT